ncbi:hypothetical protein HJG60_009465 [Phyllostomus discolor]|uniref:Uncharacterized protein n=1 Tax=Phyllostomus discolor TaxID=89673 RepID=A0A834DDK4_9CHIR|nr:hypothetical protein HJG60_009465 [Phyllostomus discolor]
MLSRASPETSPGTPAFRKPIKTLKARGPVPPQPCTHTPAPSFSGVYLCFLSPELQGPSLASNLFPASLQPGWLTSSLLWLSTGASRIRLRGSGFLLNRTQEPKSNSTTNSSVSNFTAIPLLLFACSGKATASYILRFPSPFQVLTLICVFSP